MTLNPKTSQPHRDDHRDDHGGHAGYLADSPEAPSPNGKGAEAANELLDAPAEPLAEQPLAEARRGGRYSANRSTGLRAHSHYTPNELEERAKNAWYWTQLEVDGFNTKSELVIAGMTLMCELLEEQYNDGRAFPPAPEQTRRGPSPAGTARQSQAMRAYWSRRRTPDEGSAPGGDPVATASAGKGEPTSPLWGPEPQEEGPRTDPSPSL